MLPYPPEQPLADIQVRKRMGGEEVEGCGHGCQPKMAHMPCHAMPCQHAPCSIRDKPRQWDRKRISRQLFELFGQVEVQSGTDWRLDCQGASHQGGTDCLTLPGCCLTGGIGTSHLPGVSCHSARTEGICPCPRAGLT